jgi:limonene-1,2-epoxide hydrolase
MSPAAPGNVELVERFADAFDRRDLDSLLELCHADIEVHSPAGTLLGHEGARQWAIKQWEGDTPVEVATDHIEEAGDDRVLQHGRLLFRWAESGELAQEAPIRAEFTISDGSVIRWEGGLTDLES